MGCCQQKFPLREPEFLDHARNKAENTFAAIEAQSASVSKNLENQLESVDQITDLGGHLKSLERMSLNLEEQAKLMGNDLGEQARDMNGKVEVFVNDNIKDPALAMGANIERFVRENIQETLDAISDLKLKQRVSDIIYPIFRKFFVHSVHGSIEQTYKICEILGQGGFSIVRKAVHIEENRERAVKMISKTSISSSQMLEVQQESEILKNFDHPNIIRIIEIIEDTTKINIITELCKGGELFDRIINSRSFSESVAAKYMHQILSGVIHIHSTGFIHKDLKPENILFVDEDDSYLKIIDFGISQKSEKVLKQKNIVGSAYYVAPEVIAGEYSAKCDVWSCGVILYIMLCGHPPFNASSDEEIFTKISRGVFNFNGKDWTGVSKDAKILIQKMLTKDVNKRVSAEEAWNDPWIQNMIKGEVEDVAIEKSVLENLAKFTTASKLQQATLSFIASNLMTSQEISELKNAFVILDSNGDGHLSASELRDGYSTITMSSAVDVSEILKKCDMDLNGTIDYNEFITATVDWANILTDEILLAAFRAYDKDKSGTISVAEIKEFLGAGEETLDSTWGKILNSVDTNGDGVIDFTEFKSLMLANLSPDSE